MSTSESVHVLVVEDDRGIQRLLADYLTKQGFTVTVERDGEWALKTFEKKHFEVVLLDLLLPALNGYEVARKMRSTIKGKKTPIIMISGVYKNALHQKEAVLKHGAFAFLEKPLRMPALLDTIKRAVGDRFPKTPPPRPPPPPLEDDEVTGETLADHAAREETVQVEAHARKAASGFEALRGDLSTKPFPEVLAEVYRWKGSGALLLRRDKVKKIVYFREGRPLSVKSNLLSECLGRVMVREKMISQAECEESLTRMKSSGRQQGTVLIEMGCISPHNLVYALTLQLQTKLFDLFSWTKGEYQLNPKAALPKETVDLDMTTAAIIYEGVRRSHDAERLGKVLAHTDGQFVHPSENPLYALQDAGLGEDEQQLLNAADGHKTVATLRALSILPPLETGRFLYAMKCSQMIEFKDRAAEGRARPVIARMAEQAPKPPPLPPVSSPPPLPNSASAPPSTPWSEAPSEEHTPVAQPSAREAVLARAASSLLPELSGVVSTSNLSSEEGQLRERLANTVTRLRKQNYFEILGVPQSATREEIKRAYFALAKEYHPDKHFGSSSAEVRRLAGQIYDLISTAHDTLCDPEELQRYLSETSSGQGQKQNLGDEVGRILAAEGKFQKGEELLAQKNYKAAHQAFEEAIALYADEGEFHAYLGWTLFQLDPQNSVEAALSHLERATQLDPKVDKIYLFSGYIHKATGRPDKAERQFEKAIQCNPDCTEALRELRLLGKRRR